VRIRLCVSTRQRPQGAAPKPANRPVNSAQDARTSAVHCLSRLALDRPRIVDIELDNVAGRGCGGHQGHARPRTSPLGGRRLSRAALGLIWAGASSCGTCV